MRVLHLSPEYPPQKVFGLGRFVHDLATAQAKRGDSVAVVTNSLGGNEYDATKSGVRVCRIDFPPPPKPPLAETQVLQFSVSVIVRALKLLEDGAEWDIANAHDWYLLPAADVLRRHFGIPICLTVHDTAIGKALGALQNPDKFIANVEVWGCTTADSIICCTEFMRREIAGRYGAPQEKVSVVPCGVSESTFAVGRLDFLDVFRSVVAEPDDRVVLYVGRLDPEKGVDVLIDAVPAILEVEPRAKFVLVGKGKREGELKDRVRASGCSERVAFTGYAGPAPLAFLYRCAEVLVCPSLYEPFGMVALEGMINGVPVVASDRTGLGEVVEHGRNGLQFETGNPKGLAGAVRALLKDEGLRRRLAGEAERKARREYNWDRIAELTVPAYEQAIAVRGAA